jgi:hypothetical protein
VAQPFSEAWNPTAGELTHYPPSHNRCLGALPELVQQRDTALGPISLRDCG